MLQKQLIVDDILTNFYQSDTFDSSKHFTLFLHGWGQSGKSFAGLAEEYTLHRRQWIALDLPGFGGTNSSGQDWDVSEYGVFVAHFLEKIGGVVELVVGHSFGGRVMLKMGVEGSYPSDKAVFIASGGVQKQRGNIYSGILMCGKKLLKFLHAESLLKRFQKRMRSDDYLTAGKLEGTFKKVVAEDLTPAMERFKISSLLIWGDQDKVTPLAHAYYFEKHISGAKLQVILGGTHFVHHESPKEIYTLITDFEKSI